MLKTRSLLTVPIALVLGLTLAGPSALADDFKDPDIATTSDTNGRQAAEAALASVRALLAGDHARGGSTAPDHGQSLTMALRNLYLLSDALSEQDQERAAELAARPPSDAVRCATDICVHYFTGGRDAPDLTDDDADGTPDYIEMVRDTVQSVHETYVDAGYRRPKPDGSRGGGTDKVDIYVSNLGSGLYGYCSPEGRAPAGDLTRSAYCALDDDYAGFPRTALANIQVTAAHEYFHAIQFGYDVKEDDWLYESTATWAEDELFDDVNDNRQYLRNGPLGLPYVPIDYGNRRAQTYYGAWIWWRYLTEKFSAERGLLPRLVLDVWKRADGRPGAPNRYSTRALADVLRSRDTSIRTEIVKFQAANRRAKQAYEEGAAYRPSPAALKFGVGAGQAKAGAGVIKHMSSRTVRFNPRDLSRNDWRLRLTFDLPPTARGAAAAIIVYKKDGTARTTIVRLDKQGGATRSVPFSSRSIAGVDAVLVNASTRFKCGQKTSFSCHGEPKDDGLTYTVTGRSFR